MQVPTKLPRYRWVILAVAWMASLTVFLARLSVGPLAPFLKEALELSNVQVGSLVSATGIIYMPTLIVAGWLVDRVGVRRMLVAGTLITGVAISAVFFAPSYRVMFIILALSGLGTGCIFPSVVKGIILWFPARERATALGINQTGVNVAGILGASLLPTVAITLGWRYGFLFPGFVTLAISLCCAILYRNPPQENLTVLAVDKPDSVSAKPSTTRLTIELFKSRDIWMLILACFFLVIVEYAAMTNLVLYLKEDLLFGVVAAGGLLAMTEAAGAFGKPTSGFVSDRLLGGRRKIVFLSMCLMVSITCLGLAVGGQNLGWLLYPILLLLGVSAIGWGGLYATLVGELAGKEAVGTATGAATTVLVLGVMTGPPLFGYIVDSTGSFQIGWLAMALAGIAAAVFVALIREHNKRI
jgi:sugar phosphate permease